MSAQEVDQTMGPEDLRQSIYIGDRGVEVHELFYYISSVTPMRQFVPNTKDVFLGVGFDDQMHVIALTSNNMSGVPISNPPLPPASKSDMDKGL
jgi:hypothetical protein